MANKQRKQHGRTQDKSVTSLPPSTNTPSTNKPSSHSSLQVQLRTAGRTFFDTFIQPAITIAMGVFKLFALVTVVVSATLYGVINKLYIPKPKRVPCPLPPKQPKSKKSNNPPKRAAKEFKQRTPARNIDNDAEDELQAELATNVEEQIASTHRRGTKDQVQTTPVADTPEQAIPTSVNGTKTQVHESPVAATEEQINPTPVGKPKNDANTINSSEQTALASRNGVEAGERIASTPVHNTKKQTANINAYEEVPPIFSRKRKDRTPRRPVPSLPSPPQRPITPLSTPSEASGYGTAIEGLLSAPGNGTSDQRQTDLVARIKEQIASMPALMQAGEPQVKPSATSTAEQPEPVDGEKSKDQTTRRPAPPAPSTSSASRESAAFHNPASTPSQAPMETELLLGRKQNHGTPPRTYPSSGSTPPPPSISSSSIEDPAIETSFPTPPPEFASFFEMVEPGNLKQASNLTTALSALKTHMSTSLRIIPGTTRTTTLITLIQNFYFTWSNDRVLPTSGTPKRRNLMAREIACLFLVRYGRALWPSPRQPAPHLHDRSLQFDRDSHVQEHQHADYKKIGSAPPRRNGPQDLRFSLLGNLMTECVEMVFELPVEKRVGPDWRLVGLVLDDAEVVVGGKERVGGRIGELSDVLRREITGEW